MHSIYYYFLNINLLFFVVFSTDAKAYRTNCTGEETELKGKVAVITGAGQGIGFAIVDNFLKRDLKVAIILDINREKGIEAEGKLNQKYGDGKAVFIECDVTVDLEDVADRILEQYGYVDILVNNAGIADEFNGRKTIMTNALAEMEWSVKFWHHMRTDKGGYGGTIINISAGYGYYISPFLLYYKAAASSTISFSKGLGHEYNYRKTGVRVIVICPDYTYTAMVDQHYVWHDQAVDHYRTLERVPRQTADDVGKGTVQVFETAGSGTAWAITGGEPPEEAPICIKITFADIEAS